MYYGIRDLPYAGGLTVLQAPAALPGILCSLPTSHRILPRPPDTHLPPLILKTPSSAASGGALSLLALCPANHEHPDSGLEMEGTSKSCRMTGQGFGSSLGFNLRKISGKKAFDHVLPKMTI